MPRGVYDRKKKKSKAAIVSDVVAIDTSDTVVHDLAVQLVVAIKTCEKMIKEIKAKQDKLEAAWEVLNSK